MKKQRGGRRPGAGRKPTGDKGTRSISVTLLPEQIEYLRSLGDGNVSQGIRNLVETAMKGNDR